MAVEIHHRLVENNVFWKRKLYQLTQVCKFFTFLANDVLISHCRIFGCLFAKYFNVQSSAQVEKTGLPSCVDFTLK